MLSEYTQKLSLIGAVATLFVATSADAQLIYLGAEGYGGTGLGAVNTVLTIQNRETESGSVGLDNLGNQVITGDAKTGASQTLVRSLGDLGISTAADLRVVFNANEPGTTAGNSINLTNLVLSIFSPTGTLLFESGAFNPISFADTFNGTGNAGFVFGLDSTQAALAQTSAFSGNYGLNLVGLSASASQAAGGPETFFVANVSAVPEPSTYSMLALGLLGIGFLRRRNFS